MNEENLKETMKNELIKIGESLLLLEKEYKESVDSKVHESIKIKKAPLDHDRRTIVEVIKAIEARSTLRKTDSHRYICFGCAYHKKIANKDICWLTKTEIPDGGNKSVCDSFVLWD